MAPPAILHPERPERRASYPLRALRILCFSTVIGIGIALLNEQNIVITLIYSVSIGLLCWTAIDGARMLLNGWQQRARPNDGAVDWRTWPSWAWMVAIVIVGSGFGLVGGTALGDLLTGEHSNNLFGPGSLRQRLSELMLALVPSAAITYFFRARSALEEREASVQVALRQAAESRLRLLEAQLEPHMFFNTLANLQVLIAVDPRRAQAMLERLIGFLRATLNDSRLKQHPLRAEFARLRDYLALMQVRMEHRLRIHFELPDSLADILIPPLLLQPLVENGIKHGLEPAVAGGLIDIRAIRDGASMLLRVRDTGVGLRDDGNSGTGFGLTQIRERLRSLYGNSATLILEPAADAEGGTVATIRLPLAQLNGPAPD